MDRFDPESIDLAALAAHLERAVGIATAGAVVGRTRLRDEVVRHLGCSQLEGERLVDTMVGRGFLLRRTREDGMEYWTIKSS
ncbi:MAG: hypothetical protein IPM79_27975 [Polyangiaceae bacterium]|nr:hypothetical protein [Polyangiaceae bacterium]MBK8941342.1 hypothetical protein [Polyangiaceae bacterium]